MSGWQTLAACRGLDPDLFFPGRGVDHGPALAICAACPVRLSCLEEHLEETIGVWGGTTGLERRRLRQARRRIPKTIRIKHGTENGYRQHRRIKEVACEACRFANNAAKQERRKNRRAA